MALAAEDSLDPSLVNQVIPGPGAAKFSLLHSEE